MKVLPPTACLLLLCTLACRPTKPYDPYREALLIAIDDGDLRTVKRLIREGRDVNSRDEQGYMRTPLMWAIALQKTEIARCLLDSGVDPNLRNKDGQTALHMAVQGRDENASIARALIQHNADVNARDNRGLSVLSYAKADPPAPKLVEMLSAAGARE
jgi:ankyrin repeat protein